MRRFLDTRILVVVALVVLIAGALYMAAMGTQEAPHRPDALGGHDHDGDGKPDH